jgi:hypothetical protein
MGAGTFNRPAAGYGQHPGYGQQPGHGQQPVYAAQAQGKSGMAVAGLVFGIISMVLFWVWAAVLFGPPAIILGILGRNEARRTGKEGAGMGQAGFILGIVALVLTVPWAFVVAMS